MRKSNGSSVYRGFLWRPSSAHRRTYHYNELWALRELTLICKRDSFRRRNTASLRRCHRLRVDDLPW
jgi:hypothetical protein